jgi:hypothetical protein
MSYPEGGFAAGDPAEQVFFDPTDQTVADQAMPDEQDQWANALTEADFWGPQVAAEYARRQSVAKVDAHPSYDENGVQIQTPEQRSTIEVSPDVLIFDLVRKGFARGDVRTWVPGFIERKLVAAGWTISRREIPASEQPQGEQAGESQSVADDWGIDVRPIEPTDGRPGSSTRHEKMDVERIVMTGQGQLFRFVGSSDASTFYPNGHLRLLRNSVPRVDSEGVPKEGDAEGLAAHYKRNKDEYTTTMRRPIPITQRGIESGRVDLGPEGMEVTPGLVMDGMIAFLQRAKMQKAQ